MYTMIFGFIVNFSAAYVTIEYYDMGLYGAALTNNIYFFSSVGFLAVLIVWQ